MATKKLSDITAAISPPALTDTVVGVQQSGPNDLRWTFQQVQATVELFTLVATPPTNQISAGTPFQLAFDAQGNLYICYANNKWAKYVNVAPFGPQGFGRFVIQGNVLYFRTGRPPPLRIGTGSI